MEGVNRAAICWHMAVLIVFQMVGAPLASALGGDPMERGCEHGAMVHAWHAATQHSQCAHDAPGNCSHCDHASPADGCHCVHIGSHAQAATGPGLSLRHPLVAARLGVEPKGPAFPAPVFRLLRPPN
jgi:hypothetical protein